MPIETQIAVNWALAQTVENYWTGEIMPVTSETPILLVDKVREYFNANDIAYVRFGYDDLLEYL